MNIGQSESYASSFKANLQYTQTQFQGTMSVNGKEYEANISIEQLSFEFTMQTSTQGRGNMFAQGMLDSFSNGEFDISKVSDMLKNIDTDLIGYDGKALDSLSKEEANALISEGGFFSIENTAERIADFVIIGAGDNVEMLRAGRAGVEQSVKEAENVWGGKLPDIAYESIKKALEKIDARFEELGIAIFDEEV